MTDRTRRLLRAGSLAGPRYIGVGILELLIRPGFDLRRHPWHGPLHFMAGGIGLFGVIAAALVFSRRFGSEGRGGWAAAFTAGVVLIFAWTTLLCLQAIQPERAGADGSFR